MGERNKLGIDLRFEQIRERERERERERDKIKEITSFLLKITKKNKKKVREK